MGTVCINLTITQKLQTEEVPKHEKIREEKEI